MKLQSTNPGRNYELIGEVETSTAQDVAASIQAARAAQPSWMALGVEGRILHLKSFMAAAKEREAAITRMMSLETGRPIATSEANFADGMAHMEAYLRIAPAALSPQVVYEDEAALHTLHKEPWGVLACISPWNFPFLNIAWQCFQPLLGGNAVVFKNSEENPLFTQLIAETITASSLPAGVFNVLYGDGQVGDMLAHGNVDMILFTGSTRTGQHLMNVAAEKFIPIHLELGGSSPGLVFEDADLESVAQTIFNARFDNSGQYCDGLKRLLVHSSLFDTLTNKLVEIAQATKVGEQFAEGTALGPLVAKRQLELLQSQVADAIAKGATVLCGGKQPEGLEGAYYAPTILTGITKDMRVWHEEVFGPVLAVLSFSSEAEAIELANATDYGLSAYVYTQDKERYQRVARQLKAGLIIENNVNAFSPLTPFGGYKKSGIGRQNGLAGFDAVTQVKVIAQEK